MYCAKCGSLIAAEAAFCAACGHKLAPPRLDPSTATDRTQSGGRLVDQPRKRSRRLPVAGAIVGVILVSASALSAMVLWRLSPRSGSDDGSEEVAAHFVARLNDGNLDGLRKISHRDFYHERAARCRVWRACKAKRPITESCFQEADGPEAPECAPRNVEREFTEFLEWIRASGYTPCIVLGPPDKAGEDYRRVDVRCREVEDTFPLKRLGDRWTLDGNSDRWFLKLQQARGIEDIRKMLNRER